MTARRARQNTEAELEAFDRTCERLGGFNPDIAFEWVDGFLASLAAAQRVPDAAEWIPALCGDAFERAFADPEDQAQALAALQARLEVLCDQLDPAALLDDPELLRLDPLIAEYSDEERQRLIAEQGLSEEEATMLRTGMLWAEGFITGADAFPALWEPPAQEEDAEALFQQAFDQIGALLLPTDSDEWKAHLANYYPKDPPTREELLGEACMSVQDLRLYWVDFAPKTETRRVEPTPGRNDPCPCGSGKKYKKCHGAQV